MNHKTKSALITIIILAVLNGLAIGLLGADSAIISGMLLGLAYSLGEQNGSK
jgi:hypothetical protein